MIRPTDESCRTGPGSRRAVASLDHMTGNVVLLERLLELLAGELGTVKARSALGGFGLYHQGVMFGLVCEGVLYLRGDEATSREYGSRDSTPFMSVEWERPPENPCYWSVPDDIIDDSAEFLTHCRRAYDMARDQTA